MGTLWIGHLKVHERSQTYLSIVFTLTTLAMKPIPPEPEMGMKKSVIELQHLYYYRGTSIMINDLS